MGKKEANARQRALRIFELRNSVPGITQREIAERLGMSRSNVAQYERGKVKAAASLFDRKGKA